MQPVGVESVSAGPQVRQQALDPLLGEGEIGLGRAVRPALLAVGQVAALGHDAAVRIGC